MNGLWSYRRLCLLAPTLVALLGLASVPTPKHEVFPFFCWFLFPISPERVSRWGVEVTQFDGAAIDPSWIERLQALGPRRHSMDMQVLIQNWGAALQSGDSDRAAELRQRFEGNFLRAPCGYRVVRRSYDPLQSWRGARDLEQTVVASFECSSEVH